MQLQHIRLIQAAIAALVVLLVTPVSAAAPASIGPPANATTQLGYGVVYVRVPRSTEPMTFPGAQNGQMVDPSKEDTLPEVHFIHDSFNAPGQLVWLKSDGTQQIIYDCVNSNPDHPGPAANGKDTCVPMDPAVSYDGGKVAFAVYHGNYDNSRNLNTIPGRNGEVGKLYTGRDTGWAGIYTYDFTTETLTAWEHNDYNKAHHIWDTAPVWLPNGKMMFTSTRGGMIQRFVEGHSGGRGIAQQLWIADVDGSHAHNVDPHDQLNALHPFVHSSGRVFFSSHQYNAVRTNGRNETGLNLWWMQSVDWRGGDLNAHLHAHRIDIPGTAVGNWPDNTAFILTAPHFFGERSNGDICADIYYRGNNFGAGTIACWPALADGRNKNEDGRTPLGHEGVKFFDAPAGFYVAIHGTTGDTKGSQAAHIRDPAGIPGNQLMFAGGIGSHSQCHSYEDFKVYADKGWSCDFGIYISTTLPLSDLLDDSTVSEDTRTVVNSPDWHEFMPKPILKYSEIYEGMEAPDKPKLPNSTNGSSIFASASAFIGDVTPVNGWHGPSDPRWCEFQGCALQAVDLSKIKYMRFWKAITNDKRHYPGDSAYYRFGYSRVFDTWGQKLELLGDVEVQPDGSFAAELPANTPFLMSGVDELGRSIARHQELMSLRRGEKQVCSGCHLHSPIDSENAQRPFADTDAGRLLASIGHAVKPTIRPGQTRGVLEFEADIYPMLKQNCGSCHGGSNGNHKPIFTDTAKTVYKTLLYNDYPSFPYIDHSKNNLKASMPWVTRYVNVFFARESLLYWKAAGKRLDGRTDDDLPNDFNFGQDHPAKLTAAQLKTLADWIEAGNYYDPYGEEDYGDTIFRNGFD